MWLYLKHSSSALLSPFNSKISVGMRESPFLPLELERCFQTFSSPHIQASRHSGFVELSKPFLHRRKAGTKGQLTQTGLSQSDRCPSLAGRPGQSQSQFGSGWGLFCRSYYTKAALILWLGEEGHVSLKGICIFEKG